MHRLYKYDNLYVSSLLTVFLNLRTPKNRRVIVCILSIANPGFWRQIQGYYFVPKHFEFRFTQHLFAHIEIQMNGFATHKLSRLCLFNWNRGSWSIYKETAFDIPSKYYQINIYNYLKPFIVSYYRKLLTQTK